MTPEEIQQLNDKIQELTRQVEELKGLGKNGKIIDWPTASLRIKKLNVISKGNSLYGVRSDDGYYVGDINFLTSGLVLYNINSIAQTLIPNGVSGTYDFGSTTNKWRDIYTTKFNGATPLAGTKVYYVSDSSGGAVTRKLTFIDGILTSET